MSGRASDRASRIAFRASARSLSLTTSGASAPNRRWTMYSSAPSNGVQDRLPCLRTLILGQARKSRAATPTSMACAGSIPAEQVSRFIATTRGWRRADAWVVSRACPCRQFDWDVPRKTGSWLQSARARPMLRFRRVVQGRLMVRMLRRVQEETSLVAEIAV